MNTKKLLSMLLVSLGALTLTLTSCNEDSSSSTPAPTPTPSETPVESSTPEVSAPDSSTPVEDSSTPEEVSTPDPSTPVDSSTPVEVELPEETVFDVEFNYDDANNNLTVWTGFEVNGTIAPHPQNISENPDIVDKYTCPTNTEGGYYYFAIDENGYIIYASYGLAEGYGSPCDGYYHNQEVKDIFTAEYWSLHLEYAFWPNKTEDGRNAWTLYDFIVPEGGFIIKGQATEPTFKSFWKAVTGQGSAPIKDNSTLENSTAPGALNKFYVSINENRELSIRERLASETAVDGVQEEDTPAVRFEHDPEVDTPKVYTSVESVNALDLSSGVAVTDVKGVITNIRGGNVIMEDENGAAILLYNSDIQNEYAVGDTIVVSGTAVLYNGHPEIKDITSIEKVERYGAVKLDAPIEVNEDNVAETWVMANNYQVMKIVKAQVLEINANGSSKLKLGDTEVVLYKATLPENVVVGDMLDLTVTMEAYKDTCQARLVEGALVAKYYGVSVDVDGVDGTTEEVTHYDALDADVILVAKHENPSYVFVRWEKYNSEADTWEEVEGSATMTVKVTENNDRYRAVFDFGPWESLGDDMELDYEFAPKKVNADAGGDALAIITDPTAKFHVDGAWTGGSFNTSWRYIVAVDKDGKVCYAVINPANGYGGPSGSGYYCHPDYAEDYTKNPAFNILEGYGPWTPEDGSASAKFEIVVPEGGFIITGHGSGSKELVTALSNGVYTEVNNDNIAVVNSKAGLNNSNRVFYDEANGLVKIFNSDVDENATLNGMLNTPSDSLPTVYNDQAENVTLGDFTVAVDANGKVIFASRTSSGYGGPGDGFYHDGTYAVVAGETCGIFVLDPLFAGWPNTTEDGRNAWTLYTVKVPTGGHIVTGTWKQMEKFLKAIDLGAVEGGNYFEGIADGLYAETVTVQVTDGTKISNVNVITGEVVPEEGLVWTGTTTGKFKLNTESGLWEATVELAVWNNIIFTYTDAEGTSTVLNYETATLAGIFTAPDKDGADWTKNLYHEGDSASIGKFYTCTGGEYVFTFDAATKTLTAIDPVLPPREALVDLSAATVFTSESTEIALDALTVAYDANGKVIFASYTAPGYGGPGDGFYHDGTYKVEAGKQCGIFNLDAQFAGWPNKTEDGQDAWTLYKVVAPEGVTIVTGSVEVMLPIVNAIFEQNLTEMANNAYLEGLEDASFDHVVVKVSE